MQYFNNGNCLLYIAKDKSWNSSHKERYSHSNGGIYELHPMTDVSKEKTSEQIEVCWNNNENNKLLEIKPTLGEWKQSFKKPRRGNYIVQTPDRSYKDNTLLFTQRKTTTNVLCMPDQIRREAHSHRMYRPRPYKKNLL